MSNREPGRHTRRGRAAMRETELAVIARTMTPEQMRAALLTVIHADARLAQTAIDAAIEQHPIQPPPPYLAAPVIEGDGNHHEPGSGEA